MKRSTCVQLILLGSAAGLAGCDDQPQALAQHRYESRDECLRDWGDEKECQPAPHGPGGYFGPRYYWDTSVNRPMAVHDDGSIREITSGRVSSTGHASGEAHSAGSISRGGFGGGGHGAGGGG